MDAFEVMDNPKDSCKTKEVDAEEIQSVATETASLRLETAGSGIETRVLFDDDTGIVATDGAIQIVSSTCGSVGMDQPTTSAEEALVHSPSATPPAEEASFHSPSATLTAAAASVHNPSVSTTMSSTVQVPSNPKKGSFSTAMDRARLLTPQPAVNKVKFAKFVVGNTHRLLSVGEAKFDRAGKHLKRHDWTVFLDVLNGDEGKDAIAWVTFEMDFGNGNVCKFTHSQPNRVEESGSKRDESNKRERSLVKWRFASRQQTWGLVCVDITVMGVGGTSVQLSHMVESPPKDQDF